MTTHRRTSTTPTLTSPLYITIYPATHPHHHSHFHIADSFHVTSNPIHRQSSYATGKKGEIKKNIHRVDAKTFYNTKKRQCGFYAQQESPQEEAIDSSPHPTKRSQTKQCLMGTFMWIRCGTYRACPPHMRRRDWDARRVV